MLCTWRRKEKVHPSASCSKTRVRVFDQCMVSMHGCVVNVMEKKSLMYEVAG